MKVHSFTVSGNDIAMFKGVPVHKVCSTFSLAREIEYATRQHVFEYLKDGEAAIGTLLNIKHVSPALVGEQVEIQSEVVSFKDHELICHFTANVKTRVVATGETGQKVLKKERLDKIFSTLQNGR
jgi:predicted thioesterase